MSREFCWDSYSVNKRFLIVVWLLTISSLLIILKQGCSPTAHIPKSSISPCCLDKDRDHSQPGHHTYTLASLNPDDLENCSSSCIVICTTKFIGGTSGPHRDEPLCCSVRQHCSGTGYLDIPHLPRLRDHHEVKGRVHTAHRGTLAVAKTLSVSIILMPPQKSCPSWLSSRRSRMRVSCPCRPTIVLSLSPFPNAYSL
jgi:hypothetical protein